uniref:Tyrosine-protein phosphatase domain-containing protein n=1 Tax=Caenorhabditis tropicalis TaxID=1561998 RepID=A0A1I7U2X3_9PELO
MGDDKDCITPKTRSRDPKNSKRKGAGTRKPSRKKKGASKEQEQESTQTSKKGQTKPRKKEKKKKDGKQASIDETEMKGISGLSTLSVTSAPATPIVTTPPVITQKTIENPAIVSKKGISPTQAGDKFNHALAKSWLDKADYSKAKSDYDHIQSLTVNVEKECKKWLANKKRNKSEDYPALDSTLVKTDDYVNISKIDGVHSRSILMGQLPLKDSEEAFWKTVFEKRTIQIYICVNDETIDFFPNKAEDYVTYGTMWINNRYVEEDKKKEVTHYKIEVLPQGCSNSIICRISVMRKWAFEGVPEKLSRVIKETIELDSYLKTAPSDETALILSPHGCGRSGFFLALSVAIHKMENDIEPCFADIVKTICKQRPKAGGSLIQFAGLYTAMFHYIKASRLLE